MPAACRLGDPISCGDTMAQGSPDVFCNGLPWTRVGDMTAGHCYSATPIASGSPNVSINNKAAARQSDPITAHTCSPIPSTHGGNVAVGSPDVFAN